MGLEPSILYLARLPDDFDIGQNLKFCISNNFPGSADAADLKATLSTTVYDFLPGFAKGQLWSESGPLFVNKVLLECGHTH